jgi:hypothetical protein
MMNKKKYSTKKKKKKERKHWIHDIEGDNIMKMDGYNDCAIGTLERIGMEPVIVYDKALVLKRLRDDGCSELEAIEWYEYNMLGAYVGDGTPAFLVRPEKA